MRNSRYRAMLALLFIVIACTSCSRTKVHGTPTPVPISATQLEHNLRSWPIQAVLPLNDDTSSTWGKLGRDLQRHGLLVEENLHESHTVKRRFRLTFAGRRYLQGHHWKPTLWGYVIPVGAFRIDRITSADKSHGLYTKNGSEYSISADYHIQLNQKVVHDLKRLAPLEYWRTDLIGDMGRFDLAKATDVCSWTFLYSRSEASPVITKKGYPLSYYHSCKPLATLRR